MMQLNAKNTPQKGVYTVSPLCPLTTGSMDFTLRNWKKRNTV